MISETDAEICMPNIPIRITGPTHLLNKAVFRNVSCLNMIGNKMRTRLNSLAVI